MYKMTLSGSAGGEQRFASSVFTVRVPCTFCLPSGENGFVFQTGLVVAEKFSVDVPSSQTTLNRLMFSELQCAQSIYSFL